MALAIDRDTIIEQAQFGYVESCLVKQGRDFTGQVGSHVRSTVEEAAPGEQYLRRQ